ncbi:ras-related protein RABC2a [Citrus sinensis]|nr:ras-related protein RABC2a [Citrus sinensis]
MGSKVGNNSYDYSFKILLIGDSGVGKSSILLSLISNSVHDPSPTIGVDFKIKLLTVGGKRLKLTIWDTAGQERFGTLTSSYYRGAHGIILVYDVTRRETFTNLSSVWAKEVELYSTNQDCVKILVGNKVDRDSERAVTREEGMILAQEHKCLFLECSAKNTEDVKQCFKDLLYKILEVPSLLEQGSAVVKNQILKQKEVQESARGEYWRSNFLITCVTGVSILEAHKVVLIYNKKLMWLTTEIRFSRSDTCKIDGACDFIELMAWIYKTIKGLPLAWVVKTKKKISRIVQWKPMAYSKINFVEHQPSINAPPSVTRKSDEHDDMSSLTSEQLHETSEEEVLVDDHQEQTDTSDDAHDSEMDKIDLNIYELKSKFKDFKETVVGFIDSLTKRPNKDSLTARSYAAPDDYGVYTDVGNQNFSTPTSLYSFYGDVSGESVQVFTEAPPGISKFGRVYRPSYVFNSPYMIPPFRGEKSVRLLPPPQIMDHAIDMSTSVDVNSLRGLEDSSLYDEFD